MLNEGRRLSYWDPLDMGIGIFHVVVVVVPSLGTQFLISRRSLIVGQTDTRSRYPSNVIAAATRCWLPRFYGTPSFFEYQARDRRLS